MLKRLQALLLCGQASEKEPKTPFSDDFQELCALITHLGSHEKSQSRKLLEIAGTLGFPPEKVERILTAFPCFFRKSKDRNTEQSLFSIHLRYDRRKNDRNTGLHMSEPMNPQEIGILINLLIQMVSIEKQESRFVLETRENNRKQTLSIRATFVVASLSAVISLVVAMMK